MGTMLPVVFSKTHIKKDVDTIKQSGLVFQTYSQVGGGFFFVDSGLCASAPQLCIILVVIKEVCSAVR